MQNRTIVISEEITNETFSRITLELAQLEADNSVVDIIMEINSDGGSVYDAMAIVGRMLNSPCRIVTKGFGQVMSAATVILAAGAQRQMSRYAWFMVHEARDKVAGSTSAIGHLLNQARKEELQWAVVMEELTDTPKESWLELSAESTYMTAADCLQFGVIDTII